MQTETQSGMKIRWDGQDWHDVPANEPDEPPYTGVPTARHPHWHTSGPSIAALFRRAFVREPKVTGYDPATDDLKTTIRRILYEECSAVVPPQVEAAVERIALVAAEWGAFLAEGVSQ